jgi:Xaa-Pro aminopeptidase
MLHRFTRSALIVALSLGATSLVGLTSAVAQAPRVDPEPSAAEYRARREALLSRLGDGILVVPSVGEIKSGTAAGLRQEADFFYFTGLPIQVRALLVLDGPRQASRLYVPWPVRLPPWWKGIALEPGSAAAARLELQEVAAWDAFVPYLDQRIKEQHGLMLYLEESEELPFGGPPGLPPVFGRIAPLRYALERRWPGVKVQSANPLVTGLRAVKRPVEIAAVRRAAHIATAATLAALHAIGPGRTQRQAESAVVLACLEGGADDVAWWPWVMTGPNAVFPATFASFADYRHLNRRMAAGELARIDVGCVVDHYHSDVGRTAPVSGRWTPEQRETWDLLIAAYRAGLKIIRDGSRVADVLSAFRAQVRMQQPSLRTARARQASEVLLSETGAKYWQIHHVGLEPAEGPFPIDVLRAGMIVAYEPIFVVDGEGYYLEDLLLITKDGYEVLTEGLPYSADEIERAMTRPTR